jgi:CheY-like chemotaxis protein
MASAFEALAFELLDKPTFVTPSVLRTIASTVDFIDVLFDHARDASPEAPPAAQALVVDDDPLSNRLVVAALRRANLQARSTEDPQVALQWLAAKRYDLVLLDIEMPGMNGFEVCRRLRLLPGYEKTPVIYVTAHADFANRAKSILSGGGDFISKPVFPIELAVKVLAHLLRKEIAPA